MKKIIAVTSGKAGTGKTSVSLNLAVSLCRKGNKVCLLDAGLSLINMNTFLDLEPGVTISDLIEDDDNSGLEKVMLQDSSGLVILPLGDGIKEVPQYDNKKYMALSEKFKTLEHFDFMIVDTPGGVTTLNVALSLSADETIVLMSPEQTSLTNGFAVIKIMMANKYQGVIHGLPNNFPSQKEAVTGLKQLQAALKRLLDSSIDELQSMPADPFMAEAVANRKALSELFPGSSGSRAMMEIASGIGPEGGNKVDSSPSLFIKKVFGYTSNQSLIKYVGRAKESIEKSNGKGPSKAKQHRMPATTVPHKVKASNGDSAPRVEETVPVKRNGDATTKVSAIAKNGSDSYVLAPLPAVILESQKSVFTVLEKNIVMHEKVLETLLSFASGTNENKRSNGGKVTNKSHLANETIISTQDDLSQLTTEYVDIDEYISAISTLRVVKDA